MKTFLSIYILFLSLAANAQIIDLGVCRADKISQSGLEKLKEKIGDTEILFLGEQVHGIGTDYENFAFLVKFLHEELGFNVIAQEYCFYSFGALSEQRLNGSSAQVYRDAMYWPQAKAKEFNTLFEYIDEQSETDLPIFLEGIDPRIFKRNTFIKYIDSLLTQTDLKILNKTEIEIYLNTLRNVVKLEYNDTITNSLHKEFFYNSTETIISNLTEQSQDPRTIQNLRNLIGFAKNAWNSENLEMNDADRFQHRFEMMAENILWMKEQMYPNEKILVRLHNGHAAKNLKALKGAIPDHLIPNEANTGKILHNKYGNKCMYIGLTHYSGTYCNWDYKAKEIPKPENSSIEEELHNKGYDYAYIDLNEDKIYTMFFNEFNSWVEENKISG